MKTLKFAMFMFLFVAYFNISFSQDVVYSAIFKNVNKDANSLNHYLNTSGDTLFLKSTFDLNKIEIIGTSGLKEYALNDTTKDLRIPLIDLPVGDYTMVVVHTEGYDDTYIYRKTIIFKVSRLLPIDLNSNSDMNILASNLTYEEGQIPILDLSENKIIRDFPSPVGLANNENVQAINLESKNLKVISNKKVYGSLASLSDKEESNAKRLKLNRIDSILESNKPSNIKAYNLTDIRNGGQNIQSRADYRRNNLRPNGKSFD